MPVTFAGASGGKTTVGDEALAEFRMFQRGPVLVPGEPGYEEARVVQNAMFDRRPAMIVRCTGTADVVDVVRFARSNNILVSVRAGGHSVAGLSIADDALMIDLSLMGAVQVDRRKQTISAQGGATWGAVDRETQAFGLATPGGVVSTTGVAGLTLGGGIGWLRGLYGLCCDNLISVELVTAEGEVVTASADENADLFWGVRGGGGNFGIVTSFEFQAHPVGPIVMFAAPVYRLEEAPSILRAWRDWGATIPDEVTAAAFVLTPPEHEGLPPEIHNQPVLILGAVYAGPADEGERVLQPLRELGVPLADLSAQVPYRFVNMGFDWLLPKGEVNSYWKSLFLRELSDDAIEMISKRVLDRPTPISLINIPLMGGAVARVGAEETAFGDRSAPYMFSIDGNFPDPGDKDTVVAWVRDFWNDMEQFSNGQAYLNFIGQEGADNQALIESAYGANLKRLQELKRKYDPDNFFRLNQNITP